MSHLEPELPAKVSDDHHAISYESGREGHYVAPKSQLGRSLAIFTSGGDAQGEQLGIISALLHLVISTLRVKKTTRLKSQSFCLFCLLNLSFSGVFTTDFCCRVNFCHLLT